MRVFIAQWAIQYTQYVIQYTLFLKMNHYYMASQISRANNQIQHTDWPKIGPITSHTRSRNYWTDFSRFCRLFSFTDPKNWSHVINSLKTFLCSACPGKYLASVFRTDLATHGLYSERPRANIFPDRPRTRL